MTCALDAVRTASLALAAAGTAAPEAEARTLVAHVLAVPLGRLALARDLSEVEAQQLAGLVGRRAAGAPIQHLTGVAHFRSVSVAVGPGVFVPRPETEAMTGWAVDWLRQHPRATRVVELCAGSGVVSLALTAEVPGLEQHAVELDEDAYVWAERNIAGSGINLVLGDMADAFAELNETVDLVIANPPYIPLEAWESVAADVRDHDPALALWSGDDGLDAMRVVAGVAARLLRPGGVVAAEHADVQATSAPRVLAETGAYTQVRDHLDLAGRARYVTAVRAGGVA